MNSFLLPIDNKKELLPLAELISLISKNVQLDGSHGVNRAELHLCQIRAGNDYEAIQCWLKEYQHKSTTHRTYQKEADRLLLWCIYQQKKPLSGLDKDDLTAYFHFLSDPQPAEFWCAPSGGRGKKRGNGNWRPFAGPLNPRTKGTAIAVIGSLFDYLARACYIKFNPLTIMRKQTLSSKMDIEQKFRVQSRILEIDEWYAILDTLDALPEHTDREKEEKERLQFLVAILYFLGLRIGELANHTVMSKEPVNKIV